MKLHQQYILASDEIYNTHGKERFPYAVDVNTYKLAPFLSTEREAVEQHCIDNNLAFSSPGTDEIINQITNKTTTVILTDIENVLKVKAHFQPDITEE